MSASERRIHETVIFYFRVYKPRELLYNFELLGSSDPNKKIYRAEKERLFTGFRIFAWLYRRIGTLPLDLVESLFFICGRRKYERN